MAERPFARVYYVDLEKDYPAIFYSPDVAVYVRLLAIAEAMWPKVPEVPRSEPTPAIARLVASGLVEQMPRARFAIKGLDVERTRRQARAREAAAMSWQSRRMNETPATAHADADATAHAHGHASADASADADAMLTRATSQPARPDQSRARKRARGEVVDERDWTEDQRRAAIDKRMQKLTGVKAEPVDVLPEVTS